jgi:hypothetical protein
MSSRFVFLCVFALCISCKKPPLEASWAQFYSSTPGDWMYPLCQKENDGKRYLLRGYLRPQANTTVEGDKVQMDFFEKGDSGPSIALEMIEGKHVKFDTADMKNKWHGGGMNREGKITGVTLLTKQGDARLDEKVGVIVEQKVLLKFKSDEISACQLFVDDITK